MLGHFLVFTKSGFVLWNHDVEHGSASSGSTSSAVAHRVASQLVSRILVQGRNAENVFEVEGYEAQWLISNDHNLVFAAVYEKALQLPYMEEVLEAVQARFLRKFFRDVQKERNTATSFPVMYSIPELDVDGFDEEIAAVLNEKREERAKEKERAKKSGPRSFAATKKGQEVLGASGGKKKPKSEGESSKPDKPGPGGFKPKKKGGKKDGGKKDGGKKDGKDKKKGGRRRRLSDEVDLASLDFSAPAPSSDSAATSSQNISFSDDEDDDEVEAEGGGWFSRFIPSFTGKELTADELDPIVSGFRDHLIEKNVATEIADKLCESIRDGLVGKHLSSFSSLTSAVRTSLQESLNRILTPSTSIDIVREVQKARSEGRPYSITFVGINGVGKSTSLSKVCAWLQHNGFSVMMVAGDTFRSAAVEQLLVHARALNVPLFQQGYNKDPAQVAKFGIKKAKADGIDVVLIDTAGRLQDNEKLMHALSNLVNLNRPDLVLFVGEALVGNDGLDQLVKFNRALQEFSSVANPRMIDGVVLSKFDTIDDKVGAALSMVYTTGQPIVFVGTGQHYTDLKKLNVNKIVTALTK